MRISNLNQPIVNKFNKRAKMSFAVVLSAFFLAGMTSCTDDEDDPIVDTVSQQDKNFASSSSEFINSQLSFGQLALDKGVDDSILDYAKTLLEDNTASKSELEGIASSKKVTISKEVTAAMKTKYDELSALSRADFDKAFIRSQIEVLDDAKSMFQNQIDNGENYTISGFADKTLSKVKDHKAKAVLVKAEVDIEGL